MADNSCILYYNNRPEGYLTPRLYMNLPRVSQRIDNCLTDTRAPPWPDTNRLIVIEIINRNRKPTRNKKQRQRTAKDNIAEHYFNLLKDTAYACTVTAPPDSDNPLNL
jgi:hypothetical protein